MLKEITKSIDKYLLTSNTPLFQTLSVQEKIFVANRTRIKEYNKGDAVYYEGQEKDGMYIMVTGRVCLSYSSGKNTKKKKEIEVLRKGDYFGIISLLTGQPHSVSAEAINDSKLLMIDKKEFEAVIKKIPKLAVHFSQTLSRRIKNKASGKKEIYSSEIIAVIDPESGESAERYAKALSKCITSESGKKVKVLHVNRKGLPRQKSDTLEIKTAGEAGEMLSDYTCRYHFVILAFPVNTQEGSVAALKQSDKIHLLTRDNPAQIQKHITAIKHKTGKSSENMIIIAKEAEAPLTYRTKLCDGIECIGLPKDNRQYGETIKRIARKESGTMVGLALGSGGAMGLTQIGILEMLEKENIPIDVVAGTSIGSLIGGLWAMGFKAADIDNICSTFDSKLTALGLVDITLPKLGLIGGQNVRRFLTKYLGNRHFYDTKIPLKIVACDILTRKEEVLCTGSVVDAIMSSIAIPGVFNPVKTKEGKVLVDGGIVNPVPVSVLARMGIKRIIAVNSMPSPEDAKTIPIKTTWIGDIMVNSIYSMQYRIGKHACEEADVYMHPVMRGAAWYEFYRVKEFIKFGRKIAVKALPEIKKLIKN